MLVKKMPILQGFPGFETVKILSKTVLEFSEFNPIFYDIETTGLSRYSTFLYLIGAVVFEAGEWQLYQWFGESGEEEPAVLSAFAEFLKPCTHTIQYNGSRFDQPYLEERYALHHLPSPFHARPSLDLYQQLKTCQPLLKLSRMKQPDLEAFLGMSARACCDGRECIRLYREYVQTKDSSVAEMLLGHNREDLLGLGALFSMLSYLSLYQGGYFPECAQLDQQQLILTLRLSSPVPIPVSNGNRLFYIRAENDTVRLLLPLKDGKLRQYYTNYKEYDYLPAEDTAIPKSLSTYIDKKLRTPAKPDTCYTWFPCSEAFLKDSEKQMQYLRHSLVHLLETLKTNNQQ